MPAIQKPFGQADCESEVRLLKDYNEIYFDETPFNLPSIRSETYLIVGRRGSGKTALSQYFSFQKTIADPIYIDVNEPEVYQQVLSDIAARTSELREMAIPRLRKVWEYVLWCVICEHTKHHSTAIAEICNGTGCGKAAPHLVNSVIDRMIGALRDADEKQIDEKIEGLLNNERLLAAKLEILRIAKVSPIIVALDTLERYNTSNAPLMNAMAALVQCAASFNLEFSEQGIHLKAFMSGEVFPYLAEEVIQNPLKTVKDPVYLFWRPKDLLRLICWRFFQFLKAHDLLRTESQADIAWANYNDVFQKVWAPYFGAKITNGWGLEEDSFSYVLRHTQMRPRQLIVLCNSIAALAQDGTRFPDFTQENIREGVRAGELRLADEIINSFSSMYPRVGSIVDALMNMPMLFKGNELDRRARQSASDWPQGSYSQSSFRRLVTELGIVGRVQRHNEGAGYIDAEFEYSLEHRLPITHRDQCVIHPMFYRRLNVDFNCRSRVMPFSTDRIQNVA